MVVNRSLLNDDENRTRHLLLEQLMLLASCITGIDSSTIITKSNSLLLLISIIIATSIDLVKELKSHEQAVVQTVASAK